MESQVPNEVQRILSNYEIPPERRARLWSNPNAIAIPDDATIDLMESSDPTAQELGIQLSYYQNIVQLKRSIAHRCDGPQHTEDVAQEAFYAAFKYVSSGRYKRQGKPFIAFVITIAQRIIASYWRTKLRRGRKCKIVPLDGLEEVLPYLGDDIDIQLDNREELSKVELFLASELDPQTRKIFERYTFDGESSTKVGAEFGIKPKKVRDIARKVRKKLKRYLAKH